MLYRYFIILSVALSACSSNKLGLDLSDLKVEAKHYTAAMGSGNGVTFMINATPKNEIWIDSVIIAGKSLEFSQSSHKPLKADANYFVSRSEAKEDHSRSVSSDPILSKNYQPAYLIVHEKGKDPIKCPLKTIISTQTTE